jgi:hypothetical protein
MNGEISIQCYFCGYETTEISDPFGTHTFRCKKCNTLLTYEAANILFRLENG